MLANANALADGSFRDYFSKLGFYFSTKNEHLAFTRRTSLDLNSKSVENLYNFANVRVATSNDLPSFPIILLRGDQS